MLAKYNLHVGNSVDEDGNVTPLSNPTGIQDETAIAYHWDFETEDYIYPFIGTIEFSSDSQKGTEYGFYEGSVVETYVNDYVKYLIEIGVTPINSRILTREEVIEFGFYEEYGDYYSDTAPEWVYSTSYWVEGYSTYAFGVDTAGVLWATSYSDNMNQGIRPVIEISVDDIEIPPSSAKMVSGDYDTVGSEVAIGDEHFYVISSTDTTVTMLSKYNLHVGNIATVGVSGVNYNVDGYKVDPLIMTSNNAYMLPLIDIDDSPTNPDDGPTLDGEPTIETIPIENPSGIQDASAKGITDDASYIGVDGFGSFYWNSSSGLDEKYGTTYPAYVYDANSSLYSYIENYKIFLQNYGIAIFDARLIAKEELLTLGCRDNSCMSAPSWVYSTSYWTGSANGRNIVIYVESGGSTGSYIASNNVYYGVRPVITISKSEF